MSNYFNTLTEKEKINQLNKCRFMQKDEFSDGVNELLEKNIVIVGCGAQGLNQGLNMRDSGLNISYVLRQSSIDSKKASYQNAIDNGFTVGNFEDLIPNADASLYNFLFSGCLTAIFEKTENLLFSQKNITGNFFNTTKFSVSKKTPSSQLASPKYIQTLLLESFFNV